MLVHSESSMYVWACPSNGANYLCLRCPRIATKIHTDGSNKTETGQLGPVDTHFLAADMHASSQPEGVEFWNLESSSPMEEFAPHNHEEYVLLDDSISCSFAPAHPVQSHGQ